VTPTTEIEVKSLDFYYNGTIHALQNISLPIYENKVTALIGPSGCGKTTLLRCFNRMHDLYPRHRYEGEILFQNKNIQRNDITLSICATASAWCSETCPFPGIAENIAGLVKGVKNKSELVGRIEEALKHAALWTEVGTS
jgi:phosphate transport system ATP-binding protein